MKHSIRVCIERLLRDRMSAEMVADAFGVEPAAEVLREMMRVGHSSHLNLEWELNKLLLGCSTEIQEKYALPKPKTIEEILAEEDRFQRPPTPTGPAHPERYAIIMRRHTKPLYDWLAVHPLRRGDPWSPHVLKTAGCLQSETGAYDGTREDLIGRAEREGLIVLPGEYTEPYHDYDDYSQGVELGRVVLALEAAETEARVS